MPKMCHFFLGFAESLSSSWPPQLLPGTVSMDWKDSVVRGEEAWNTILVNTWDPTSNPRKGILNHSAVGITVSREEVYQVYTSMCCLMLDTCTYVMCPIFASASQPTLPSTIACPAAICSRPCCVLAKPTCPATDTCGRLMWRFQPQCYKRMSTSKNFRYSQANHFGRVAFNRSSHLDRIYLEGTLKSIKMPLV